MAAHAAGDKGLTRHNPKTDKHRTNNTIAAQCTALKRTMTHNSNQMLQSLDVMPQETHPLICNTIALQAGNCFGASHPWFCRYSEFKASNAKRARSAKQALCGMYRGYAWRRDIYIYRRCGLGPLRRADPRVGASKWSCWTRSRGPTVAAAAPRVVLTGGVVLAKRAMTSGFDVTGMILTLCQPPSRQPAPNVALDSSPIIILIIIAKRGGWGVGQGAADHLRDEAGISPSRWAERCPRPRAVILPTKAWGGGGLEGLVKPVDGGWESGWGAGGGGYKTAAAAGGVGGMWVEHT